MHSNALALFFPALFVTSDVLAQLSGVATSYTPDVTYPAPVNGNVDAFVFCSGQDCTGCEVVSASGIAADNGHGAPNGMGFVSMYWHDPGNYAWNLYTTLTYDSPTDVQIEPNTCYNLYDNGVLADYDNYFYFVQ